MYYVYFLIDPENEQVFYVGKGKGDRAYTHSRPSSLLRNTRKNNKIKSILSKGLTPVVSLIHQNLTEANAFKLEQKYISDYGRLDVGSGTLCNHSNGGEGQGGRVPWNKGKCMSPTARYNMSMSRKLSTSARNHYLNNIDRMIKINTGKKRPDHSEWMHNHNPNRANDAPAQWVNKETKQSVYGGRHDVCKLDPTAVLSELGHVITGKYKSHRGWTII